MKSLFHSILSACPPLRDIGFQAIRLALLLLATNYASAQVLIDFGPNDVVNGVITTNPASGGIYWNNMTSVANGASITNLVTTNNLPSTIAVTLTSDRWAENGIQNGGLTNPSPALLGFFAVPTATEDYFFVNQTFGTTNGTVTFRISGLNPSQTYNLQMFGTRNTAIARTTTYSITDIGGTHSTNLVVSGTAANSGTNPQNTQGNDKTIVSLNAVTPNPSGQLTFNLIVGDSQNFAYLGILFINTNSLATFAVNPQSQTDRVGTTNTLTALFTNTAPVSYQWYFANTNLPASYAPVPGATSTNLVLANVGYTNAGSYYLLASNAQGTAASAVAVVSIVPPHFAAQDVLIDFGPNDVSNGNITTNINPAANGNYWNNMTAIANGSSITNLVNANGTTNTVSVTITSATWAENGIQNGGLLSPTNTLLGDFAIPTVTQDYFFIQNAGATGTFQINGLNPLLTYNLSMFASRNGTSGTDTRNSIYSVTDVNGIHSVTLQSSGPGSGSAAYPNGNDDTVVSLNALVPNASGQINFTLSIGPNAGNNFAYIGALEITTVPIAPTFTLNPFSQTDRVGTTNTLNSFALSSQPVNYQWYFADTNVPASFSLVPGATGTNLVLANVGYINAGSYYVVASNSLGSATSAVAVVSIVPPHVPAQAILIDFGPNDAVSGTNTSSPDLNGNYWNNMTGPFNVTNGTAITNLVTANNTANTVGLTINSGLWQANGIAFGGLTNPAAGLLGDFAIPTVTEDYFFVGQTFGTPAATQTLLISGLNPGLTYNLSMFGSRNSAVTAPTVRTTTYSVTDMNGTHSVNLVTSGPTANSGTNPSNTGGNDKTIVSLNGLVPNASGQLTFSLSVGDTNNFAYLGALEITFSGPAPVITVNPQSQTNVAGSTITLNALATNSLPVNYQWYFADTLVFGATTPSLVLTNVVVANAGNYYVVASNVLGTATSAVAVVTVNKATPTLQTPPTASAITYGQPLSSSTVTGAVFTNLAGAMVAMASTNFVTPNIVPNAGTTNVQVYFVPTDTANYNNATNTVTVQVNRASNYLAVASSSLTSGYHDSVYFIATVQTNGVTAANATSFVVFSTTNGAFSTNTLVLGTTNSLAVTDLPRGANLIIAEYAGDNNYLGYTNTLIQIVTNHPPVAGNATNSYLPGTSFKITIADLLTNNVTDQDGDTITLTGVGFSTNGMTQATNATFIQFHNTNNVDDNFTYTVSDGYGGSAVGTVFMQVNTTGAFGQGNAFIDTTTIPGVAQIRFFGIPGRHYSVWRSTNDASGPYNSVWTTNAPVGGQFIFTDDPAPSPAAYYKLSYP